ncbi:MAG TPA: DUF1735 domain-containing protein [Pedobacter sp.]|nr:DUF1735 domain-containing protein [Pedobacter sp.]
MKSYKIYTILVLTGFLAVSSCKKNTPAYEELTDAKTNASVYIVKSTGNTEKLSIFPFTDDARTLSFSASFGAVGYPKTDIPVKFTVDDRAFDSINVVRQNTGLPLYLKFPTDAYTVSSLTATIASGTLISNPIKVNYFSKKFDPTKDYLLPLSINSANGYKIGASKTMFIIAGKVQEVRANTTGWIATASSEQPSGENTGKASALIDGDLSTIWHAQYSGGPAGVYPYTIQFDMINPIYVTKVSIAPRQNNGNGPTLFKLEGSLDGITWTTLLDNQVFDPTKRDGTYQNYPLAAPTNLKFLKTTLLQGKQALSFLSEIAVYRY